MNEIDEAIKHFEYGLSHSLFSDEVAEYVKTALEALNQMKENRWIPVTERLPDEPPLYHSQTYNVITAGGAVLSMDWLHTTVRDKGVCRWEWKGRISPFEVTHWRPLPPKEDKI